MSTSPTVDYAISAEPVTAPGTATAATAAAAAPALLVALPSMTADALQQTFSILAEALAGLPILVASPDVSEESELAPSVRLLPFASPRATQEWVLGAADYAAAGELAAQYNAHAVMVLGGEATTLPPTALRNIAAALQQGADLALPRYHGDAHEGLVSSSLLYPMCRALFGIEVRSPLPRDAGMSARAAVRLGNAARRLTTMAGGEAMLWPVAEAATAGFTIREVDGNSRPAPRPPDFDFNTVFTAITGSLFADIEQKAAFWQRARSLPVPRGGVTPEQAPTAAATDIEEIKPLVDDFHNAFVNLREIWSLVLPPQSLVQLKRLSLTPAAEFSVSPNLWARTAYDFALAFRQRTLNRGHLLGALTPLYLAWVASYLRVTGGDLAAADRVITGTAAAFEQEKPYFIARWRSPDRFNP